MLVSNGHESIEFYYTEGRPAADGAHNHGTIRRDRPTSRYNVLSSQVNLFTNSRKLIGGRSHLPDIE